LESAVHAFAVHVAPRHVFVPTVHDESAEQVFVLHVAPEHMPPVPQSVSMVHPPTHFPAVQVAPFLQLALEAHVPAEQVPFVEPLAPVPQTALSQSAVLWHGCPLVEHDPLTEPLAPLPQTPLSQSPALWHGVEVPTPQTPGVPPLAPQTALSQSPAL
jgi:hypothetical protein